jgi:hypothetical protein
MRTDTEVDMRERCLELLNDVAITAVFLAIALVGQ